MMTKIAIALIVVVALFGLVHAAGSSSICDRYSGPGTQFANNTALMTAFVTIAFGRLLDQPITNPYFTGKIGQDMYGNTIDYTKNTSAFNLLAYELVAFFGSAGALGCTDADYPVYNDTTNMAAVHKNNKIDKNAFEVFNQQLTNIAQVVGFNHSDYAGLSSVLESFRGDICTASDCNTGYHTIFVGSGGAGNNFFTPSAGYSFAAPVTITWVWDSNATSHSVIQSASSGSCSPLSNGFSSGVNSGPHNFTMTFNTAGTYYFYCGVSTHCQQGMYGEFQVTGGSTSSSTAAVTTNAVTTSSNPTTSNSKSSNNGSSGASTSVLAALVLLVAALLF